jgi:hypothetical protein
VGDVRGRGLMIGIELVKDKATREPAVELRNRVETLAFERGLMMLGCGETSLRLCPPLIVSKEEATVALDILEDLGECGPIFAQRFASSEIRADNGCRWDRWHTCEREYSTECWRAWTGLPSGEEEPQPTQLICAPESKARMRLVRTCGAKATL